MNPELFALSLIEWQLFATLTFRSENVAVRYEDLQRRINEEAAYDYNAGIVKQNLREFRNVVNSLTPEEKTQALQCMVKQITVLPDKLLMDVYELADFKKGSSNRSNWLQR